MKTWKPLLVYLVAFAAFALIDRFLYAHPVIEVLAMAAMVLFAARLLGLLLSLVKPKERKAMTMVSLLSSLLRYVAALVILCWGLSILGVNVNAIVASVGIVALIVGFGAESLVADVVTGIFLIFENQYNVGDIVEVNGFRGTVKDIGIRTTSIMDPGENIKIINNSEMKNILNRSDNISRAVSDIAIPYETDLEVLEAKLPKLMEDIFAKRQNVMLSAPQYLGVQQLADSAVILRFVVEVAEQDIYSGARILNRDLWLGFRSLGVECPFPQVDVHSK
ncbi:MAG: mechanosensitive ion channel [Clostridia bacterium]|nr:mechanosensitive ion channel [Clostridia bacterium]MBQ7755534.1 mechanosensitive ion channel [Clostridia bacterium]MBQ9323994.1 mechanosensitive ion channel [Clostridia bacterium]MBR0421894.1 mechanosensitive ion channel [Clostridia bacterium]